MRMRYLLTLSMVATVLGCSRDAAPDIQLHSETPRWVLTAALEDQVQPSQKLSGVIRARFETPLAFQVGGRIQRRLVDAGQTIEKGQRLFELDARDFEEALSAAKAELEAAKASVATAQQEFDRQNLLSRQKATSEERLNQTRLALREAESRVEGVKAKLTQAQNALNYTVLESNAAGILLDVTGEVGQVVSVGQAVATLAQEGDREVELFLPDGLAPPATGFAVLANGERMALELRERAGSADSVSRTWRTRYRIVSTEVTPSLGSIVPVVLPQAEEQHATYSVPLTAIDERGGGPRIWQIVDGKAVPTPVEVVSLTAERANINTALAPGTRVISLGTHLLNEGMLVRERN